MVWVVIDEDPWPDTYVPIYGKVDNQATEMNRNRTEFVYYKKDDAIEKARELQVKYSAKVIRIFYHEGFSKIV